MGYGEGMSPADVAAVTNHNNGGGGCGGWGGDFGSWIILFLIAAMFGGGFGGFGGFGGGGILPWLLFGNGGFGGNCREACATQADLAAGFNNSAVLNSLNDIKMGQAQAVNYNNQGYNGLNTAILSGFNGVERGFCDISHQISNCCCDTRQAIGDVKYTIAQEGCETRHAMCGNTRDIIDNANANSRAILDFLVQDKLESKNERISQLENQLALSNQTAAFRAAIDASTAEIIRRTGNDCPIAAYQVPNPHCCYQYAQPACGCGGNGF